MLPSSVEKVGEKGLEAVNLSVWSSRAALRHYARIEGWDDRGERASIARVAERMRGLPILDLGCGAGRTTEFLREVSEDYVGVDITPEMIELARVRYPDVRFEVADARELSLFDSETFGLVNFSANGIDAVDVADRRRVLVEILRVLRPGGLFVFSSHNLDHPTVGVGPLHPRGLMPHRGELLKTAKKLVHLPWSLRNHLRLRGLAVDGGDWAIRNDLAHDFGIVIMYVSLPGQIRALEAMGFGNVEVYRNRDGARVYDVAGARTSHYLYYVASKPEEQERLPLTTDPTAVERETRVRGSEGVPMKLDDWSINRSML